MMKSYGKCKINIYGSQKEIDAAETMLNTLSLDDHEAVDRLIIQDGIDLFKIKADILYDGNTVWSYDRLVRDFARAFKSKPSPPSDGGPGAEYSITNYLYEFLHLSKGIAHYSKLGWCSTYPSLDDLKRFCHNDESGASLEKGMPSWKTDAIRVAKAIVGMC